MIFNRQFYVPIPIMWPTLSKYAARYTKNDFAAELAFRTFMVLVTRKLRKSSSYYRNFKIILSFSAFGSSYSKNWLGRFACGSRYGHFFGKECKKINKNIFDWTTVGVANDKTFAGTYSSTYSRIRHLRAKHKQIHSHKGHRNSCVRNRWLRNGDLLHHFSHRPRIHWIGTIVRPDQLQNLSFQNWKIRPVKGGTFFRKSTSKINWNCTMEFGFCFFF